MPALDYNSVDYLEDDKKCTVVRYDDKSWILAKPFIVGMKVSGNAIRKVSNANKTKINKEHLLTLRGTEELIQQYAEQENQEYIKWLNAEVFPKLDAEAEEEDPVADFLGSDDFVDYDDDMESERAENAQQTAEKTFTVDSSMVERIQRLEEENDTLKNAFGLMSESVKNIRSALEHVRECVTENEVLRLIRDNIKGAANIAENEELPKQLNGLDWSRNNVNIDTLQDQWCKWVNGMVRKIARTYDSENMHAKIYREIYDIVAEEIPDFKDYLESRSYKEKIIDFFKQGENMYRNRQILIDTVKDIAERNQVSLDVYGVSLVRVTKIKD